MNILEEIEGMTEEAAVEKLSQAGMTLKVVMRDMIPCGDDHLLLPNQVKVAVINGIISGFCL